MADEFLEVTSGIPFFATLMLSYTLGLAFRFNERSG